MINQLINQVSRLSAKLSFICGIVLVLGWTNGLLAKELNSGALHLATLPEEFRCSELKGTDFQKISESFDSLNAVIKEAFGLTDCSDPNFVKRANPEKIKNLVEMINQGIEFLKQQGFPGSGAEKLEPASKAKIKASVEGIISGIRELKKVIDTNPLNIGSEKNCNTQFSSQERIIFGITQFISDISPVLVQVVGKVPELSAYAGVVVGISMGTDAINYYAQHGQKRLDIRNVENQKMILLNTCQLVKTYKRAQFLRAVAEDPMAVQADLVQRIEKLRMYVANYSVMAPVSGPSLQVAQSNLDYLQSFKKLIEAKETEDILKAMHKSMEQTQSVISMSNALKNWLGNAKNFYWPTDTYRNPVMDLMNHFEFEHLTILNQFRTVVNDFDSKVEGLIRSQVPRRPGELSASYFERMETERMQLNVLNAQVVGVVGSSSHQRTCQGLQSVKEQFVRLQTAANINVYFCSMIQPLLDEPVVATDLRERCEGRGNLVPDPITEELSRPDELATFVAFDYARFPIIKKKLQELSCPSF